MMKSLQKQREIRMLKKIICSIFVLCSFSVFAQDVTTKDELNAALKDAMKGMEDKTYVGQIPGSDFSSWHTETISGFLTFGSVECTEMPGKNSGAWDTGNPAFAASGSKNWPTQRIVLKDGSVAAQLVTRKVFGKIASGSLFTGRVVRKLSLKQLLGFTDKDGGQLINFGVKFNGKPKAIRVKFAYNGLGDECSISATLENRSSGQRDIVASALFIGSEETKNKTNCVTKVSEPDANGLRTLQIDFLYGEYPIGQELPEGVKQLKGDTPVTHVNVCFSSSAHGDRFKGVKGAQLIIKDFEFIY